MDNQIWVALAAQMPIVAAFVIALNRGWIYVGRSVDQEHADWAKQLADYKADCTRQVSEANARTEVERADRIDSDERTTKMADSLREATEVMRRSVELHEQASLGVTQGVSRQRRS